MATEIRARDATPNVSIVTPTLNQAAFLADTLASVERQWYGPIEHIVVDGGSSDGSLAILTRWQKGPNRSWSSGADRGMYDAINHGMRHARGDILGYLNSDDVLVPWAIATVMRVFEERPDVDLVFGDAILLDGQGRSKPMFQIPVRPSRLARFGSLVQPAVFWRRRLAERIGAFDDDLRFVGDLDYWLRAVGEMELLHVNEVLAVVRDHPDALTRRHRTPMRLEERAVRARHHPDGRTTSVRSLLARAWYETALRLQWLRFVRAVMSGDRLHWARFRAATNPRVDVARLAIATLPLVGRVVRLDWLQMRTGPDWFEDGQSNSS